MPRVLISLLLAAVVLMQATGQEPGLDASPVSRVREALSQDFGPYPLFDTELRPEYDAKIDAACNVLRQDVYNRLRLAPVEDLGPEIFELIALRDELLASQDSGRIILSFALTALIDKVILSRLSVFGADGLPAPPILLEIIEKNRVDTPAGWEAAERAIAVNGFRIQSLVSFCGERHLPKPGDCFEDFLGQFKLDFVLLDQSFTSGSDDEAVLAYVPSKPIETPREYVDRGHQQSGFLSMAATIGAALRMQDAAAVLVTFFLVHIDINRATNVAIRFSIDSAIEGPVEPDMPVVRDFMETNYGSNCPWLTFFHTHMACQVSLSGRARAVSKDILLFNGYYTNWYRAVNHFRSYLELPPDPMLPE